MRIVITSSAGTVEENKAVLDSSGSEFIFFPTIEFEPLVRKKVDLTGYEWVVVSSRKVYDFLSPLVPPEEWRNVKVAVVGEATARYLREKDVEVAFVSPTFTGEDFARAFGEKYRGAAGRILRPASSHAPEGMVKILRGFGMQVDTLPLYRPVCPSYPRERIERLKETPFQGILFTSPSTWRHFKRIFGPDWRGLLRGRTIGAIGPTTGKALEEDGYKEYIQPEEYTLASLIKKMEGESS